VILTTLYRTGAKNTNNWHTRKEDLQCAFPLNVLMVPSSPLVVATNSECLSCGGCFLGETIRFGSLKFIADHFSGLSLSPSGDVSDTIVMGFTHSEPPSPSWTTTGNSVEDLPTSSNGEGRIDLPSFRRHDTGTQPTSATTIPQLENPSTAQATMTIPSRQATPRSDTNLPLERQRAC
jgi:hypothetical protein